MAPLRRVVALGWLVAVCACVSVRGEEPPRTGPQTEKRFPPLKVPAGFKATLFACDPLIEYPSVIAAGPKANQLFVAIDYMTGLGEEIIRRDEIRLIEDTDADGYADKATVYASGFNSIQGLAYHDGRVYVMHAPFLTVLRDTKGTGVADERRDLLTGLGLPPEKNRTRLHCANGVTVGHDGWLYLSMGDNGTDVKRPEGDRLVLNGGGILRCRPDGTDLHVFATGLRNIYDVALDAELNVFVRDNENDGGTYKIRVCHSFFGADHGYPYLYDTHPDEALPPIADLGLGSSAGGVCYLERAFPKEYRGDLFFCEWGRSVVRYSPRPSGSAFGQVKEVEFAVAAEADPYGFKRTDIVVQRDGAMMISDWADGQRPKRGRGRIYRVVPTEVPKDAEEKLPAGDVASRLDSTSYYARTDAQRELEGGGAAGLKTLRAGIVNGKLGPRARAHALWALARWDGARGAESLLALAQSDPDPSVRLQAIRALGDVGDPVLVKHKLDAGPGDTALAQKLAALGERADARTQREVLVALARLKWSGTPEWIAKHVTKPDAALGHAAQQALRRCGNWPAVIKLLERPTDELRAVALRAAAEQYEPVVVDGLIERLKLDTEAASRVGYADALARVHRKPGPWVYWGYRPGPRPANTVDWERTTAIADALDRALGDTDRKVRLAVLKSMQREKVPVRTKTIVDRLRAERDEETVAALLESLRDAPATLADLKRAVREKEYSSANRLRALALITANLKADDAEDLLSLLNLDDGPALAELLRHIGRYPKLAGSAKQLVPHTTSTVAEVRAAAIGALGELLAPEGKEPAMRLLEDAEPLVRRAAVATAGKLAVKEATEPLIQRLAKDPDASMRAASLTALRRLKEPRAVPLAVAALGDRVTQLAAIECLGELGGPEHATAVRDLARRSPPADALLAAVRALAGWAERAGTSPAQRRELAHAVAEVHGATGTVVRWTASGPLLPREAAAAVERFAPVPPADAEPTPAAGWRSLLATDADSRVHLGTSKGADTVWFAHADVVTSDAAPVEFTISGGAREVWLNGKSIYRRPETATGSARFAGELVKGDNRVLVRASSPAGAVEVHLSFRRKSATAAHERLTQLALAQSGNAERGRSVFLNVEKSLCLKCHRVGDKGEAIGPELTGIGARFGRVYLVESILDPNRAVVPGFATARIELKDERVLTGVKVTETDTTLTLADTEGKKYEVKKADIAAQRAVALSTMPEGLEKRLTEQEFVDLIAYLVSLKDRGGKP